MPKNRAEIVPVDFTPPEGMVFFRVHGTHAVVPPTPEEAEAAAVAGAAVTPEDFARKKLEMQVLPVGKLTTVDGRPLAVTPIDLQIVLLDLSARENEVAVLYEHGMGPRGGLAGGWLDEFSPLCRTDKKREGLFAVPDYTATATKEIRAREWRYVSPGFFGTWDEDGFLHPRVLVEVSLTNVPAIDGMLPVAAGVSLPRADVPTTAQPTVTAPDPPPKENHQMDEEQIKALIAAAVAPINEQAKKLEAENLALKTKLDETTTRLAQVPDETRQTVTSITAQRETEQELVVLTARATKAGLLSDDDAKASFAKLAKADLPSTRKMVERAEAVARAPRTRLYQPDSPRANAAAEGADAATRLTAALRLRRASGLSMGQALREVTS